jgi:hypothetical protein
MQLGLTHSHSNSHSNSHFHSHFHSYGLGRGYRTQILSNKHRRVLPHTVATPLTLVLLFFRRIPGPKPYLHEKFQDGKDVIESRVRTNSSAKNRVEYKKKTCAPQLRQEHEEDQNHDELPLDLVREQHLLLHYHLLHRHLNLKNQLVILLTFAQF